MNGLMDDLGQLHLLVLFQVSWTAHFKTIKLRFLPVHLLMLFNVT